MTGNRVKHFKDGSSSPRKLQIHIGIVCMVFFYSSHIYKAAFCLRMDTSSADLYWRAALLGLFLWLQLFCHWVEHFTLSSFMAAPPGTSAWNTFNGKQMHKKSHCIASDVWNHSSQWYKTDIVAHTGGPIVPGANAGSSTQRNSEIQVNISMVPLSLKAKWKHFQTFEAHLLQQVYSYDVVIIIN